MNNTFSESQREGDKCLLLSILVCSCNNCPCAKMAAVQVYPCLALYKLSVTLGFHLDVACGMQKEPAVNFFFLVWGTVRFEMMSFYFL